MNKLPLETLSEVAQEAHTRIQKDYLHINPVISVSQKMRTIGIPSDIMTIDCLKSGKRILIVLHDQHPSMLNYQFCLIETDPDDTYRTMQMKDLSVDVVYKWIAEYFSE